VAKRCPTYGTGQRQMFNPIIGNCTENKKLPLDGQCQLYRKCLVVESVSPFGRWYEMSCGSGQHLIIVVKNPCTETTRQNGGTCYADILWNAQCFCKEGLNEKFCEIDQRPTATTKSTTKATMASFIKLNYIHI